MSRVSVEKHAQWRKDAFLTAPVEIHGLLNDEDWEDLEDLSLVDPYETGTHSRRTDKELARVLELIDNLPISGGGKDCL